MAKANRSGNPAKRATATAADFKKKKSGLFELPSGLTVKLVNPGGLSVFLEAGTIPNSLMPIVDKALKGQKTKPEDLVGPEGVDPEMLQDMVSFLDTITIRCMVEPQVYPTPDSEDDYDDELLYVDEIDEMDKMFIFQWLSRGTSDLETFRKQYSQNLESLG